VHSIEIRQWKIYYTVETPELAMFQERVPGTGEDTALRALRVLHLRDSCGVYGAERIILGSCQVLAGKGDRIRIVSIVDRSGAGKALVDAAAGLGLPAEAIPARHTLDIRAIRRTRRVFQDWRPDVVHAHELRSAVFALAGSRGLPVATVASAHGSTRESWRKHVYLEVLERVLLPRFDRVHAVSVPLAAHVEAQGVKKGRIRVILNGVDPSVVQRPAGRNPLQAWKGSPTVCAVGRLTEDKGFSFLLRALASLRRDFPSIRLVIAGSGPQEGGLRDEVRDLGLEGLVHFAGRLDCVAWVYDLADLVVISSVREGLPCVLIETMLAGLPVVATEVGAIPEVLERGSLGALVAPADVASLTEGIRGVLQGIEHSRERAVRARSVALAKYTSQVMSSALRDLYEELARR
jgi:glycosyltransferase involved in cell wall biosynthesis